MIGILIVAHGNVGESLVECATHVLGTAPLQLVSLAVNHHDDPSHLLFKASTLADQLNSGDGVLILSDMYGATPCNMVGKLLQPGVIEGVAGINLPMLLRVLTYRHESLAFLVEKAVSGGREGVVHFNQNYCERYEASFEK